MKGISSKNYNWHWATLNLNWDKNNLGQGLIRPGKGESLGKMSSKTFEHVHSSLVQRCSYHSKTPNLKLA